MESKTYKNTSLYMLSLSFKTNEFSSPMTSYLYVRKISPEIYHYYITTIDGEDYVFLEDDNVAIPDKHIDIYRKYKINSKDSIYFTDLNLCRQIIKNNELNIPNFNLNEHVWSEKLTEESC